jgi:hypothetical protein
MANFVTSTDLQAAAFGLAHSMLEMLDRDGVGPDVIGVPDQLDVDVFRRTFEVDAELYMSMDPTRLTDEYNEIRTAGKAIDVVTNPKDILGMTIDSILGGIDEATKDEPVAGTDAIPVVNGYVEARDRLFASYEDSLNQVNEWISDRRTEFATLDDTLPEPLPAYADVDSPDFRYEKFYYGEHDHPADYAPEVERERQRYVDGKAKPDGVIAQRLAGGG